MDQMRNELMQERSARQDLECDKISLERQVIIPKPQHQTAKQSEIVSGEKKILRWSQCDARDCC